ncbi:MAG: DinB family protein [Acidobacteriota bacterium]
MTEIDILLMHLKEAFDQPSWHGVNLLGSIRRLKAEEAGWRPGKDRHNAWEIAVHAAYWKYNVYRRLAGEARGSFPLKGSNWFTRPPEGTPLEWKNDIQLLREFHRRLTSAVAEFDGSRLDERAGGSKFTFRRLILGAGAHDLYHAGQIQLLKRLRLRS